MADNFPLKPTPFVGRVDDIAGVREALGKRPGHADRGPWHRQDPAGAASRGRILDGSPDGLWRAGLASVSHPEQILGALAQALGVREEEEADLERRCWPGCEDAGC